MALTNEELNSEKIYLKKTLEFLKNEIDSNKIIGDRADQEIFEIKKYVWEFIDKMDIVEIMSFEKMETQQQNAGQLSSKRNLVFKQMLSTPYFGRIDFLEKNHSSLEKIYIGLSSISDDDFNFYVIDWRTPIASMFYDYELGKASYISPEGKVSGEIVLKRQYKIKEGILKYAFDSSLNINDDILQETLSQNATEKMKNIVTTIQKEQNIIIRNDENKTLIVEGPAGSGKTSVALHHIAYLLYKYRDKISSSNVLIFSPSDIFSEYISEVLPNLGENNVLYTSFSDYMKKYIVDYNHTESYMKFLERIFNNNDSKLKEIIACKLSDDFSKIIDKYSNIVSQSFKFTDVKINGLLVIKQKEVEDLFNSKYCDYPPLKRLTKISDYIQMKFRHMVTGKINKKILKKIVDEKFVLNFDYKESLKNMYDNELIKSELNKICINLSVEDFVNISKKQLEKSNLNYEDAILLLYLKGKLNGVDVDSSIKYVVIDEAQDYNTIQYVILKNTFNKAKFTILGDANQTVNIAFKYSSISDISTIFSEDEVKFIPLTTTYRNTYEITEFCNEILNLKKVNAINRHGDVPNVILTKSKNESYKIILKKINESLERNYNSIAIITKNDSDSKKLVSHLQKNGINCENYEDELFKNKQIHVLPIYYAKGLEFDSVIVYDSFSDLDLEKEKNLLYVACTRALHKLDVINETKQS